MDINQALSIKDNYVCARCWSPIIILVDEQKDLVAACPQCGIAGLHSKSFVNFMEQTDHDRAMVARYNLRKAGVIPTPPRRAEAQLMAELGF